MDDVVALRRLVKDLIKCVEFYLDKVNELEEENKRLKETVSNYLFEEDE